jgi:hypothetical protein
MIIIGGEMLLFKKKKFWSSLGKVVDTKAILLFRLCRMILGMIDLVFHDKKPRIIPNK